jgi:DNA-binding beta-propeller fold protein YncE
MEVAFVVALAVAMGTHAAASKSDAWELQRIELQGVEGRIDHLAIDEEGQRLFVAARGADSVEIVDLTARRRALRLTQAREPQGLAYVPRSHRLYVANGGGHDVQAFSVGEPSPTRVGRARDLEDADNLRFDATENRLYVGYGHALGALDPDTLEIVKRVPLLGHPEAFEIEHGGPRIFVNVPEAGHIAVVDRRLGKVVQTWSVDGAGSNFPMALDDADHRLFIATRLPARLMAYDTSSGKLVAELPLCNDADDLFFDGARKRIYAICGEGAVDVFLQASANRYEPIEHLRTAPGARTGLFVPSIATLFVAMPARGGALAEIRAYRVK